MAMETTTVCRCRTDHRIRQACGFAAALTTMAEGVETIPATAVDVVAHALTFSLEQLAAEHGLDSDGRRD